MLKFEAAFFFIYLERLKDFALTIRDSGVADSTEDGKKLVSKLLDEWSEHVAILPSASDLRLKIRILHIRLNETVMAGQELGILLLALHQDINADLLKPTFLLIPEQKVELFDQTEPPFGDDVVNMFPDAVGDIAAASRCLALDEWTACVFHVMRVLEHALRRFAAEVKIPMSAIYEENWHNIIDMIESEIRKTQNAKRSPTKTATLKSYSNAAVNFRYFKDAWRNHVSHSKVIYAELEATTIYNHVREFAKTLAHDLEPTQ